MKTIRAFLALLLLAIGVPAEAAFYQVSDFVPSGNVSSPAAGGQIGTSGWYDVNGGNWLVSSSQLTLSGDVASPWVNGLLARSTSENSVNQQLRVKFVAPSAQGGEAIGISLRTSGNTAYLALLGINGGGPTFQFFTYVSGSLAGVGSTPGLGVNLTAGTTYIFEASVTQVGGTSTLTEKVFAADGTTQIGNTNTLTGENTSGLQNLSGRPAVFESTNGAGSPIVPITELISFNDTAPVAATSFTFAGPASGLNGVASTNFTITPNGTTTAAVSLSDGGGGGSFAPSSLTLSGTTPQTFTYTPASAGAKTITATASGLTSSPSSLTYTSSSSGTVIAVTNAAFHFSPGNWKGDTGRAGSSWRQSLWAGAYFTFTWTAASSNPTATILMPTNSYGPQIAVEVNGVMTSGVAATGNVSISGIVAGASNTIRVFLQSAASSGLAADSLYRWGDTRNVLRVTGMLIDGSSTAGTAAAPTRWHLLIGDSNMEGWEVDGTTTFNFLHSHVFYLMRELIAEGDDVGVQAGTGTGFLAPGNGSIPALYNYTSGGYQDASSRWNKIDSGVSLLDSANRISAYGSTSTGPADILIELGTNEALQNVGTTYVSTSIAGALAAYRTAAPNARIIVVPGFPLGYASLPNGSTYAPIVKSAMSGWASGDSNATYYDPTSAAKLLWSTGFYTDAAHSNGYGNGYKAAIELKLLQPRRFNVTVH